MKVLVLLMVLAPTLAQTKNRRPPSQFKSSGLNLPDNATSIRENIVDTFSCQNRIYGYYADIDNDCQIFHVCLPQGRRVVRFSFICPTETVFNQALFVCTRNESSIPCEESEKFYNLNHVFGEVEKPAITELPGNELDPATRPPQRPTRPPPESISPQKPPTYIPTNPASQRPTRTPPPEYPNPIIPQRPTRPDNTAQFPTQRPARPPTFPSQTFTSDYPTTFYPLRPGQGSNRPWL